MKFKIVVILFTLFNIYSCNSKNASDRQTDSSRMTDSSIMNNPDTLGRGLDTSVIDTPDTAQK